MSNNGFSKQLSQETLNKAKSGDMAAFEVIYTTYANACLGLAYRIYGDVSIAQDIVQEAFIKVMHKISDFRDDGSFAGWLRKIVCNTAISKLKTHSNVYSLDERMLEEQESYDLFDSHWIDACSDLQKLTESLPKEARAILFLHEVEGYTHKEIGKLFNKTASFSKMTLLRAYKSLKKAAKMQGFTGSITSAKSQEQKTIEQNRGSLSILEKGNI